MKSNRANLSASVALSSIGALCLPLAAMLTLDPAAYGAFSLFYLVGALANSLQLSVVSEAWIRSPSQEQGSWVGYINATLLVAVLGGLLAAGIAMVVPSLRSVSWLVFLAVFAQVYRNGARFRAFRNFEWRHVLPSDFLLAIAAIGASVYLLAIPNVGLEVVLVCWAIIRWMGVLGSRGPERLSPLAAFEWIRSHKREIATLVPDGAISDVASIGTPYILTPTLGIANLGVYRAVNNVGSPLRTLIAPLRPAITRIPLGRLRSVGLALCLAGVGAAFGFAAFASLRSLSATDLDLGTLNSLYAYAVPVGLYVFAVIGSTVYSFIARQVIPTRAVITTRLVVSAVGVIAPLGGALTWGLSGAIWGYVLCQCVSAVLWWAMVRYSIKKG